MRAERANLMVFKPGGLIHDLVFNNTGDSRASKPVYNTTGVEAR